MLYNTYTSVTFDSYTMQVQKFVSFMFRTKFWPVKVNSDGVIVHDFLHPAFVLPFALYLACLSVVLYFIGPALIHSDYTKFSVVLNLILVSYTMTAPRLNLLIQSSICSLKTWDSNTSAEMSLAFCYKHVGMIVLRICFVISIQLQVLHYFILILWLYIPVKLCSIWFVQSSWNMSFKQPTKERVCLLLI